MISTKQLLSLKQLGIYTVAFTLLSYSAVNAQEDDILNQVQEKIKVGKELQNSTSRKNRLKALKTFSEAYVPLTQTGAVDDEDLLDEVNTAIDELMEDSNIIKFFDNLEDKLIKSLQKKSNDDAYRLADELNQHNAKKREYEYLFRVIDRIIDN